MGYKALDETNTGEAKVPLFAFTLSHFVTAPRSTGKGFPETPSVATLRIYGEQRSRPLFIHRELFSNNGEPINTHLSICFARAQNYGRERLLIRRIRIMLGL